jgi:glutathione S-transferase
MDQDPQITDNTLYIGTRRYSSWSLRGWLAVHLAGLEVEDVVIPLAGLGGTPAIKRVSPNQLMPYLRHAGREVWETVAICEYCAELTPALWPSEAGERALARSVAAEMHAGFRALRQAMPMNLGADKPGVGQVAEVRAAMGAADAMYAPVVARFLSYHPTLSQTSLAYCRVVREHDLVRRWYDLAAAEPEAWRLAHYESVS